MADKFFGSKIIYSIIVYKHPPRRENFAEIKGGACKKRGKTFLLRLRADFLRKTSILVTKNRGQNVFRRQRRFIVENFDFGPPLAAEIKGSACTCGVNIPKMARNQGGCLEGGVLVNNYTVPLYFRGPQPPTPHDKQGHSLISSKFSRRGVLVHNSPVQANLPSTIKWLI